MSLGFYQDGRVAIGHEKSQLQQRSSSGGGGGNTRAAICRRCLTSPSWIWRSSFRGMSAVGARVKLRTGSRRFF